jgi:hypothetical protein
MDKKFMSQNYKQKKNQTKKRKFKMIQNSKLQNKKWLNNEVHGLKKFKFKIKTH